MWRRVFYNGWVQLAASIAVGVAVTAAAVAVEGRSDLVYFPSRGGMIAFLAGIASILALVSSLTFGLLLHYLQSITSERYLLYARFKEDVRDLRTFLDEQYAAGIIDRSYDYHYGAVEEITLKDFPIDLGETLQPVLDLITEEQREELEEVGEFGPVLRGVAYRVNDMEETSLALLINWLKHTSTKSMGAPVAKAFQTLAAVILAILVAAVAYGGVVRTVLFGAGVTLATMTLTLVIEIGLVASRQTEMTYEESFGMREEETEPDEGHEQAEHNSGL